MTSKNNNNPPDPPPSSTALLPWSERPYRMGVGLFIFNTDGLVFVAERLSHPGSWQLPQGGIDDNEDIETAAFREMEEEIGTRNARILEIMEEWQHYDIPERAAARFWDGKYKGQKQKWIAMEFLGKDSDINLNSNDHPEFTRWKWVLVTDLLDLVVPFKRNVYERVMQDFAKFAFMR